MENRKYNLEQRTQIFSREILKFASKIPDTCLSQDLVRQLIKAATSIGANYLEANGAESKKDFSHKIAIAKKEAKETHYWLELICEYDHSLKQDCLPLVREAYELVLIFSKIIITIKKTEKLKN